MTQSWTMAERRSVAVLGFVLGDAVDLADDYIFLMEHYDEPGPINVGTGIDHTITENASLLRDIVQPSAQIDFDTTRPDGKPRKVLDVARIRALGWRHRIELTDGLQATYDWYRNAGHRRGIDPSG